MQHVPVPSCLTVLAMQLNQAQETMCTGLCSSEKPSGRQSTHLEHSV